MAYAITCVCGKKLASPREYAEHCKNSPDCFRRTLKHEPEVSEALTRKASRESDNAPRS